jgi:hypothetical protein
MGFEQERRSPSRDRLAHEIVTAVAEARGVDPLELDERLFDVVDPDALGDIFADRPSGAERRGGQVTFRLARCYVTIDGDRRVSVRPPEDVSAD